MCNIHMVSTSSKYGYVEHFCPECGYWKFHYLDDRPSFTFEEGDKTALHIAGPTANEPSGVGNLSWRP